MTRRPPSNLTPLGSIISDSMDRGFLGLARETVKVFTVWEQAVGAYNAGRSKPESIKDGRLTVIVESSVWIDRFGYFKTEFIEKINQALGAPVVKEIVFRAGQLTRPPDPNQTSTDQKPAPSALPRPTKAVISAVASVKDPKLKKQLAALLARQRFGGEE